jgi:CheY-like chemotaxis protein
LGKVVFDKPYLLLVEAKQERLLTDFWDSQPCYPCYLIYIYIFFEWEGSEAGLIAIALTTYAGEYDQKQGLAAGFQRQIPKPVESDMLVQAIATPLGENRW